MARKKFYQPGVDQVAVLHRDGLVRYGELHTVKGPYRVTKFCGYWDVMSKVEGPFTYGGQLSTHVLQPHDAKGNFLNFRTKRDAMQAARDAGLTFA